MPGERRFTCRPVQPREGAVHFGGDAKVVAGGIGSSAAGTTVARLTGPHREAEPTRVRGAPPCHHRLNLGSGHALGSLIPRRCEPGLGEGQPSCLLLAFQCPQAFFVVSRSFAGVRRGSRRPGTRRDPAWRARGGTRTWPKFGCSTAISTIAASIAPAMQFFKTGTQAVEREALVHAKFQSTAIGMLFRTH